MCSVGAAGQGWNHCHIRLDSGKAANSEGTDEGMPTDLIEHEILKLYQWLVSSVFGRANAAFELSLK